MNYENFYQILVYLFSIQNIAFVVPLAGFGTETYAVSVVELWATVGGLIAVIGARLNKLWWYPVGIVKSFGFIAIFYQIQLYSDLLLNIYFISMSLYGIYVWTRYKNNGSYEYPIQYMSFNEQLKWCAVILIGTAIMGLNINSFFEFIANSIAGILGINYVHQEASFPILDSFIAVTSVVAMYLLAKRKVESWILWVIVDIVCTGLYLYKGVIAVSVEYLVFLANAAYGVYQWHKASKE